MQINFKHIVGAIIFCIAFSFYSWNTGYKAGIKESVDIPSKDTLEMVQTTSISEPPLHMLMVFGEITEIRDGSLTIDTSKTAPFANDKYTVKKVEVTNETTIERRTTKDMETIQKEQQEYFEKTKAGTIKDGVTPPPTPPMPFTVEKIDLATVQIGDHVTVTSAENIIGVEKLVATTIQIQPSMPMTTQAPLPMAPVLVPSETTVPVSVPTVTN